jgi:hypothetical protein
MLDAQVVLIDGSIMWASTVPDLLWALRGTETGFAVVTKFKFQARPYPENGKIWAGPIFIPRDKVPEAAKGIMSMFNEGEVDPKVSMFLYVMRKEFLHLVGATQDALVIHCHDGHGEEHGRKTFKWALDIEGAIDQTSGNMTQKDVADLQGMPPFFPTSTPSTRQQLANVYTLQQHKSAPSAATHPHTGPPSPSPRPPYLNAQSSTPSTGGPP